MIKELQKIIYYIIILLYVLSDDLIMINHRNEDTACARRKCHVIAERGGNT